MVATQHTRVATEALCTRAGRTRKHAWCRKPFMRQEQCADAEAAHVCPRSAERYGAPAGMRPRTRRLSCWRAPTTRCSAAASGARATWRPSWTRRRSRAAPRACSATSSRRTRARNRALLRPRVPYYTLPYLNLPYLPYLLYVLAPPAARAAGARLAAACAPACHAGNALPNWHVLVQSCFSGVSAVLPRCWRPVRQSRGFVLDTLDCVSGAALAAGTRAASHSKGRTVAAHRIRLLSTYMAPGACH